MSSIQDAIERDIKQALLKGDKQKAEALKYLKSVFKNARLISGEDLTDKDVINILRKEKKSRVESIEIYIKHGQSAKAATDEYEKNLISEYLPEDMTDQEIKQIIQNVLKKDNSLDFGDIMAHVKCEIDGRADGRRVAELVKEVKHS